MNFLSYTAQNNILHSINEGYVCTVCVKNTPPPPRFSDIFPNRWEFILQILHAYCTFLSTLDYKFSFSDLQHWWSYAILRATTQFTSQIQTVRHRPKCTLAFSGIFPKHLGILSPYFSHILLDPIYARVQNFVQLSPSVTMLCYIKCDHPACISASGGHFEHIMVVALNMA